MGNRDLIANAPESLHAAMRAALEIEGGGNAAAPDIVLIGLTMAETDEPAIDIPGGGPEARVVVLTEYADTKRIAGALATGAEALRAELHSMTGSGSPLDVGNGEVAGVTKREAEVLQLIAIGYSTREVGQRLFISEKTVRKHLASIFRKLDARNRTEAVYRGIRLGIVPLP